MKNTNTNQADSASSSLIADARGACGDGPADCECDVCWESDDSGWGSELDEINSDWDYYQSEL